MLNPPPAPELVTELESFGRQWAAALRQPSLDWKRRPAPDEWSLTEMICHLRDVEQEVHQPRIRAVLSQHQPFLSGVNADSWAITRRYQEQDGPAARDAYAAAREETVAMLRDLDEAAWQRAGQHAFLGQSTLQELVFLAVQHDRNHSPQLAWLLSGSTA
jgi:uncharacterized damage-inducible protein DinB